MSELNVVVLAAGKGTRMKSALPKVLHRLAGRAMLVHVLQTVASLGARSVVVVTGHGADQVEHALRQPQHDALAGMLPAALSPAPSFALHFARQEPQLGTGHAVRQAVPLLPDEGLVLVLNGDVPLIGADTIRALVQASGGNALALLTVALDNPTGYGRIVRNGSAVQAIVEQKDATPQQLALNETYSGVLVAPAVHLKRWLARLTNRNSQHEYYLTDIVAMAVADGVPVVGLPTTDAVQVAGVNSPVQLAGLERAFQLRSANALMEQGVRLADPARLDVRGQLVCGRDVEIDVNCVFEGSVLLGDGVRIGPHCVVANAHIAAGAVIHAFTHINGEGAGVQVGEGALVGPFARLRSGAQLGAQVHIGNFVEVKNSSLGRGAKANHLSYLGDATVGERVNFGAGSITANYDGVNKHRTVIEDDVHVGSNCVLVAPVTLGRGSTVGGGSTITKNTSAGELAVARARQAGYTGWTRPLKIPKNSA